MEKSVTAGRGPHVVLINNTNDAPVEDIQADLEKIISARDGNLCFDIKFGDTARQLGYEIPSKGIVIFAEQIGGEVKAVIDPKKNILVGPPGQPGPPREGDYAGCVMLAGFNRDSNSYKRLLEAVTHLAEKYR